MRSTLPLPALIVALVGAPVIAARLPAAATPDGASPATVRVIAMELIEDRARTLRIAGRMETARRLDELAVLVHSGAATLSEAAAIMQMLPPVPLTAPIADATGTRSDVAIANTLAVLDGPGTGAMSGAPSTPTLNRTESTGAPTPAATAALSTPSTPSAAAAGTSPDAIADPAGRTTATSSIVLATYPGSDGRANLVALDAPAGSTVAAGQRYAIVRRGATQVLVSVSEVGKGLAKCIVIPGTWATPEATVGEGDEAVLTP